MWLPPLMQSTGAIDVCSLSDAHCSMTLWHRKAPFHHFGGWKTLKLVVLQQLGAGQRAPTRTQSGQATSNCRKLRTIAEIADLKPPPPWVASGGNVLSAEQQQT